MNKLKNLFKSKKSSPLSNDKNSTAATINGLREMEEMLSKKQEYLEEKINEQLTLARKYGLKNKRAAMLALKRKKRFEQMLQQVDGTLSTIELQRETLEQAKNNVSVLQAMKHAADALKQAQLNLDADKVHDVMDDIAEQQEVAREISDAISSPFSLSSSVDEDELLKELEELEQEELDKELLKVEPTPPLPTESMDDTDPGRPTKQTEKAHPNHGQSSHSKSVAGEEDKELAELAQWASTS